jgi:hypothetical protein
VFEDPGEGQAAVADDDGEVLAERLDSRFVGGVVDAVSSTRLDWKSSA